MYRLRAAQPTLIDVPIYFWYTIILHRFKDRTEFTFTELRGFHGTYASGVACQQGALTLPDTWFRPPLWDLLVLQWLRPDSSNLPCLYSTFRLECPLVLSRFCSYYYILLCTTFLWPLHLGCLLALSLYREDYLKNFWMCIILITRLLLVVGRLIAR